MSRWTRWQMQGDSKYVAGGGFVEPSGHGAPFGFESVIDNETPKLTRKQEQIEPEKFFRSFFDSDINQALTTLNKNIGYYTIKDIYLLAGAVTQLKKDLDSLQAEKNELENILIAAVNTAPQNTKIQQNLPSPTSTNHGTSDAQYYTDDIKAINGITSWPGIVYLLAKDHTKYLVRALGIALILGIPLWLILEFTGKYILPILFK